MARVKRYIEADVLTEAKRRLHHVFDIFDDVAVMFSGGKDSLATLHLTREVALERGINHVNAVFRDEELIPDPVIDFVDEYRRQPWMRMLWFAVPLLSNKYVMGVSREYTQWDRNRKHVRPAPAWAHKLPDDDHRVFDQYTMDEYTAQFFKGRLAFVTGIRSSESIMRYRASVNKLNENYITAPTTYGGKAPVNVKLVKPIFDWEENDVFKYFMDRGIKYCPIYDAQLWAGVGMRVSTPLHAEAAKRFDRLKFFAPTLYQQVIDVFPEMLAHERLYGDMDLKAAAEEYGKSYDGVKAWVMAHIDDEDQRALALQRLTSALVRARRTPAAYPPAYLLRAMMSGAYKREILPMGKGR